MGFACFIYVRVLAFSFILLLISGKIGGIGNVKEADNGFILAFRHLRVSQLIFS